MFINTSTLHVLSSVLIQNLSYLFKVVNSHFTDKESWDNRDGVTCSVIASHGRARFECTHCDFSASCLFFLKNYIATSFLIID